MCDVAVRDGAAVLVGAAHKVPDHVGVGCAVGDGGAALLDDVHVEVGHGALGVVAASVGWEGEPGEEEVHGGEARVEVVVEAGEGAVKGVADLFALEGAGCGEDGEFGDDFGERDGAAGAFEVLGFLDVVFDLFNDKGDVGFEGFGGEAKFHKLGISE